MEEVKVKHGLLINFVSFDALAFARLVMNLSKIAQEKFECELRIAQSVVADDTGCPDCRITLECGDKECIDYLRDVYKTARCLYEDECLGEMDIRCGQKVERRQRIRKEGVRKVLSITAADL